jgi:hypothetical protein
MGSLALVERIRYYMSEQSLIYSDRRGGAIVTTQERRQTQSDSGCGAAGFCGARDREFTDFGDFDGGWGCRGNAVYLLQDQR